MRNRNIDEQMYIGEITAIPLLTREEQMALFQEIEQAKKGNDLKRVEELQKIATERNLRLVLSVALRYSENNFSLLDLVQEGNIGLIKAVRTFDYTLGFSFSTYAEPKINGEIMSYIQNNLSQMKIPGHIQDISKKIKDKQEQLTFQLQKEASTKDIADECGLSENELMCFFRAQSPMKSIDVELRDENNDLKDRETLKDKIPSKEPSVIDEVIKKEIRRNLEEALLTLTEQEQFVLCAHMGFNNSQNPNLYFEEQHSQREIAKSLKCTQPIVEKIEKRALKKLRKFQDNFSDTHQRRNLTKETTSTTCNYARETYFYEVIGCTQEELQMALIGYRSKSNIVRKMHGDNYDLKSRIGALTSKEKYEYEDEIESLRKRINRMKRNNSTLKEILKCSDILFEKLKQFIFQNESLYMVLKQIFGENLDQPKSQALPNMNEKQYKEMINYLKKYLKSVSLTKDNCENKTLQEIINCSMLEFLFIRETIMPKSITIFPKLPLILGKEYNEPFQAGVILKKEENKYIPFFVRLEQTIYEFRKKEGQTFQELFDCSEEELTLLKGYILSSSVIKDTWTRILGSNLSQSHCLERIIGINLDEYNKAFAAVKMYLKKIRQFITSEENITNEQMINVIPKPYRDVVSLHLGLIDKIPYKVEEIAERKKKSTDEIRVVLKQGLELLNTLEKYLEISKNQTRTRKKD